MVNYQFLFEKEREKVKDLASHLEHNSEKVLKINKSRYEWKDKCKVLHEENQELKKQVESMRCCFNCGFKRDNIFEWLHCEKLNINRHVRRSTDQCQHWKQKEVKDGE